MKKSWWLVILWVVALLQGYFVSALTLAVVVPNLAWLFLILATPLASRRFNLLLALWGGFWLDVIGQMYFGLRTGTLVLLALALWWLQSWGVDLRSRLVQVVVAVLGQWLYQVALLLALWLDGGTFAWSAGFGLRGWLAGILTGAIVIVAGQKVQSLLGKSI